MIDQQGDKWTVGDPIEGEESRFFDSQEEAMHHIFWQQEARIANLERENRKLNDKLNRYRNVLPGRKRLITLGRIAAMLEYEADEDARLTPDGSLVATMRADALFLRRLEWDFEQAIDVVHEPKRPRHQWPRP